MITVPAFNHAAAQVNAGSLSGVERYSDIDYNEIFNSNVFGGMKVEVRDIGYLNVPSGKIVVCDPYVVPDRPPLRLTVAPGRYPVKIYTARSEEWERSLNAVVKLEVKPAKAEKWVLAVAADQDITKLEEGHFFGFSVDGAVAGLFDQQSGIVYNDLLDRFLDLPPDQAENIYGLLEAEFAKNAENPDDIGTWINYTLPGSHDLNVTMFHAGGGDGVYPAYWGMTADNEIVSLVIDFFVFPAPDKQ